MTQQRRLPGMEGLLQRRFADVVNIVLLIVACREPGLFLAIGSQFGIGVLFGELPMRVTFGLCHLGIIFMNVELVQTLVRFRIIPKATHRQLGFFISHMY